MSLINEALKKAQRQRMEGSTPPVPAAPVDSPADAGPRVTKRSKPTDFRSQLLLLAGGGLALVCALAVAGFFLLRSNAPEAPAHPPAGVPAASAVAAPATKQPEPVVLPSATPATPPSSSTAVANNPASPAATPPVASSSPAAAPPVVNASPPVAAPRTVQEPPKPAEKPRPTPRMIAIVEALKVAGIRASGAESKVLMNDRVYRLNDTIEHELNIRLVGVTTNSLTFEDERGATYTRNF